MISNNFFAHFQVLDNFFWQSPPSSWHSCQSQWSSFLIWLDHLARFETTRHSLKDICMLSYTTFTWFHSPKSLAGPASSSNRLRIRVPQYVSSPDLFLDSRFLTTYIRCAALVHAPSILSGTIPEGFSLACVLPLHPSAVDSSLSSQSGIFKACCPSSASDTPVVSPCS